MKYMHKYNSRTQMFADWDDAMDVITPGFYGEDVFEYTTGYCEYNGFDETYGFAWDFSFVYGADRGYTDKRNVSENDRALETYGTYGVSVITPVRAQGNGGPWVSYTEEPGTDTWNIKIRKEIPLDGYENETIYYWGCVDSWSIGWEAGGTQPEHLYAWSKIVGGPYDNMPSYVVLTASDNPNPGDTVYMCDYFDISASVCNVRYVYPNGIKHFYKGIVTYNCK